MVRLAYVMPTGSITKTQVFNAAGNDLHGSRPIPANLKIDFNNFFDIPRHPVPAGRNISRKIDALLSAGLFNLPIGPVAPGQLISLFGSSLGPPAPVTASISGRIIRILWPWRWASRPTRTRSSIQQGPRPRNIPPGAARRRYGLAS
jgi:hypothetical protein